MVVKGRPNPKINVQFSKQKQSTKIGYKMLHS